MSYVLPNCRFCLGHVANLTEGENVLEFQGLIVCLYRAGEELDFEKSIIPNNMELQIERGFIWMNLADQVSVDQYYEKPVYEKFTSWPTTIMTYQYEAPFKVVMENLYDINHIAGTHKDTLFAEKVEILNCQSIHNISKYVLRTHLNQEAFKKFPWWQKLLFRLLRRGKREKVVQDQPIEVYFPGVLIIEDDEEYKNQELDRLTLVSIYPRNEHSTTIVVCGQAKLNPIMFKIFKLLNRGESPVLREDKNILENCYLEYPRKIKLTADPIVDFARNKYNSYS